MANMSVGGLVSGIDTQSMIESLTSFEQAKVTRIQKSQSLVQQKISAFGELRSKIQSLVDLARSFGKGDAFNLYSSTSSDDKTATITGSGDGVEGKYALSVQQLAANWKVSSQKFATSNGALGLAGKFTISRSEAAVKADPSKPTVEIEIGATDTLKDIANKINAADGAGAKASVITVATGDYRLVLNGVDQGAKSFSLQETTPGILGAGASGLGVASTAGATRDSSFQLRLQTGGAATGTSTFADLFTGIGANNIASGDRIKVTGTKGNGDPVNGATFTPASGDLKTATVDEFLAFMKTTFGADSAAIDASGRIVLKDADGAALDFSAEMDTGAVGTLTLGGSTARTNFANVLAEGRNAFYTLDGLAVTSSSNQDETTLVGGKISLLATTDPGEEIGLEVKRDVDGIAKKIQSFLDAYNQVLGYIDYKSKATIEETKDDRGKTVKNRVGSAFTGETPVSMLKTRLREVMVGSIEELAGKTAYTSLSSIGVTTDAKSGELKLDRAKLDKALANDFDGVKRLFANSGWSDHGEVTVGAWSPDTKTGTYVVNPSAGTIDGETATRTEGVLASATGNSKGLLLNAASTIAGTASVTFVRGVAGKIESWFAEISKSESGLLDATRSSYERQVKDYDNRIGQQQSRVDSYRDNLVKQFTAMEQAMQKMQSQSSAFLSQIGSLR